jgi:hypothetical protein
VPADDWFCPTCSSARQLGDVKPVVVDTTRGDTHAADENDSDASYDSDDLLSVRSALLSLPCAVQPLAASSAGS